MDLPIWHFNKNGHSGGPVSDSALRQMVVSGALAAEDLVWVEGWPSWQYVCHTPHLQSLVSEDISPAVSETASLESAARESLGYAGKKRHKGASQNGFAIAGFVLSLTFPLLGLIFSWIALNGMKATRNYEGHGMALAGLIISIVFVGVGCIWASLMFSFFAAASRGF